MMQEQPPQGCNCIVRYIAPKLQLIKFLAMAAPPVELAVLGFNLVFGRLWTRPISRWSKLFAKRQWAFVQHDQWRYVRVFCWIADQAIDINAFIRENMAKQGQDSRLHRNGSWLHRTRTDVNWYARIRVDDGPRVSTSRHHSRWLCSQSDSPFLVDSHEH